MKYFIWAIMSIFMVFKVDSQNVLSIEDSKRYEIILNAEKYLGLRYKSKVNKAIFDCSGYVKYLMKSIDENVSRSSITQVHDGKKIDELKLSKPGDIVVFKGRNAKSIRPGHVGLVHHISNDTLYFIHSSVSKGVCIDHIYDPYYAKRFLQIRDVIGAPKRALLFK